LVRFAEQLNEILLCVEAWVRGAFPALHRGTHAPGVFHGLKQDFVLQQSNF